MAEIEVGQIWREDDKRVTREVEVLAIDGDRVIIRTVTTGEKAHQTMAARKRFGKSGGYRFVRRGQETPHE